MPEFIVTIKRPQLTPEERAKRMEEVKRAAYQFVLATEKMKLQNAQIKNKRKGEL